MQCHACSACDRMAPPLPLPHRPAHHVVSRAQHGRRPSGVLLEARRPTSLLAWRTRCRCIAPVRSLTVPATRCAAPPGEHVVCAFERENDVCRLHTRPVSHKLGGCCCGAQSTRARLLGAVWIPTPHRKKPSAEQSRAPTHRVQSRAEQSTLSAQAHLSTPTEHPGRAHHHSHPHHPLGAPLASAPRRRGVRGAGPPLGAP
jgi:hypothetical protein